MADPKVSVIVPAFNETSTIGDLIQTIRELYPDFEIIVINDGSRDATADKAGKAGATVYSHPYNIGNGAAIKSGIRVACGDILVFMDGDGQHDPQDIGKMLEYFPQFDMVVGSRPTRGQTSFARAIANKLYNWLASYVAKVPIKDLTSGFRAVKAEIARSFIYLLPNTFSYPATLTLGVFRTGRSVKYLPIKIKPRKKGRSGIRMVRDGVRFFLIIIKICTLYSPFRIFLPVSFVLFLTGLSYYLYTFILYHRFTNMSALLFMTSVIIFMMGLVSEQICQMRFERREGRRPLEYHSPAEKK
jgi:glycosyltransferase involved in cell wall biosynthesis